METYRVVLFSHEGDDSVNDCHGTKTIDETIEKINDFGSRWIFYPHSFVVSDLTNKVVFADEYFEPFIGWSVTALRNSEQFKEHCKFISSL